MLSVIIFFYAVYPVAVQGGDSATQIARMISLADSRQECDVLIVGRGGGSLEDLWSFNDERVARAIFACEIPVISAVGHEVDFTIADFVADIRAATPSAAAELAVPDAAQWLVTIQSHSRRLSLLINHRLHDAKRHLSNLQQRLPQPLTTINQQLQRVEQLRQQLNRSWLQALNNKRQQVDYWSVRLKHPQAKIEANLYKLTHLNERLQQVVKQNLANASAQNKALVQRLQLRSPLPNIVQKKASVEQASKQLDNAIQKIIDHNKADLSQKIRTLAAVSPLNTLERGYSITTNAKTGLVIRHADDVELNQEITIQLQDGKLQAVRKR